AAFPLVPVCAAVHGDERVDARVGVVEVGLERDAVVPFGGVQPAEHLEAGVTAGEAGLPPTVVGAQHGRLLTGRPGRRRWNGGFVGVIVAGRVGVIVAGLVGRLAGGRGRLE